MNSPGKLRYFEVRPDAPLSDVVRCFWFLEARGAATHTVVPDGRVEVIVHLAEPPRIAGPDGSLQRQESVVVAGQLTSPLELISGDVTRVVGIRFRSAAARDVLGCPLSEIRDAVVPATELVPDLAAGLAIAARASDPVHALSREISRHHRRRSHALTREAVPGLQRGGRVADIARRFRVSERTLQRHVLQDTGLTPKTLQRVMRFRRVHALMASGSLSWSEAALSAGYYDQSHADRDFRRFTGASPTEHFRRQPDLATQLLSDSS